MGKKGTVTVRVVSDTKSAEQGLDRFASKAQTTGQKIENAGKKMTVFASVPIAAAMGLATRAASDLEQSVGGVESVFGDAAGTIFDFGETAANSAGLSKRQVNEMAAVIGASLQGLGFDVGEAATTVVDLEKRAADMAATFGGTTEEAIQSVAAALRGERDPIEKYGVSLKQADINARVLAMGLDTSTTASKKKSEAIAALDLIMGQTAKTEGQFAREADGAAGSMQRSKAAIENASAEIGEALLPLVAKAASGVAELAEGFGNLPKPVQNGVLAIGGLVAAAGPLLYTTGKIAQTIPQVTDAFETLSLKSMYLKQSLGGTAGLAASLGAVGALVAVGATLYGDYSKTKAEAARITDLYVAAMQDENGILSQNIDLTSAQELATKDYATAIREAGVGFDVFAEAIRSQGDALESMDDDIGAFRDGLLTMDEVLERAGLTGTALGDAILVLRGKMSTGELVDFINDIDGLSDSHDGAAEKTKNTTAATEDLGVKTDAAKKPVEGLTDKIDDEKAAADRLKAAVDAVTEATDRLIGTNLSAEQASLRAEEQHASLTETLKENGTTLDIHSEKGRANREAIVGTADAALAHVEALKQQGASTDEVNWYLAAHVERLKETMRQAGMTEDEIDGYIQTLGLTPKNIATIVQLNGVAEAERALNNLARVRTVQLQAQVTGSRTAGLQRHAGGVVNTERPGGEALVLVRDGERVSTPTEPANHGPSVVTLDRQSVREIAAALRQMGRAG